MERPETSTNHKIRLNPKDLVKPLAVTRYSISDNPYQVVYVDLTYRCNMSCANCYIPIEGPPDLSVEEFERFCAALPNKVLIRFLGGEPTLHREFFKLIHVAQSYGHIVTVASNGLLYSKLDFVEKFLELKRQPILSITFNGGLDRATYLETDRMDCLEQKLKGLNNLVNIGMKHLVLSGIVIRNLNEFIVRDFFSLAEKYSQVEFLKFRSLGEMGRHLHSTPYSTKEFKGLLQKEIGNEAVRTNVLIDGKLNDPQSGKVCRKCCYHFRYGKKLKVSFVEFGSEGSAQCWRRGKWMAGTEYLEPLFANMKAFNGEYFG